MTIELITAAIIALLPTLTSVIGVIASVLKCIKNNKTSNEALLKAFNETKEEVIKTKEYESLKAQSELLLTEYHTLLKAHRELLTKIDRIARKEEDYEGKSNN